MVIFEEKLSNIQPYPKNAKEHTDKQIKKIKNSIKEFGFNQPLVVDKENVIIVGHGRYLAALSLGMETVPILVADLTEEQAMAYRLADNKLNESDWNMDLVIEELRLLSPQMINLTGFDQNLILETKEDAQDIKITNEPRSKYGDLYELGEHRLLCGDSTKAEDYEKLLGDEKARLIFTDPPYSVNYVSPTGMKYESDKFGGSGGKIFNDDKTPEEALIFYKQVSTNLYKFSTDDASLYWWYASRLQPINEKALEETKWHVSQIVIWLKNSLIYSPGQLYHRIYEPCMVGWKEGKSHYSNKNFSSFTELWTTGLKTFQDHLDVWYQKRDNTTQYIHPTQKPVQLAERALKRSSEVGDIVLDAFGGSGSTMMACEQLDRKARLIELDPKFVDAIVGRWCKYKEDYKVVKNGETIQWIA